MLTIMYHDLYTYVIWSGSLSSNDVVNDVSLSVNLITTFYTASF